MKAQVRVYVAEFSGEKLRIIRRSNEPSQWLITVGNEGDIVMRTHPRVREPEKLNKEHQTWLLDGIPWSDPEWMKKHSFTLEEITELLGIEF